MKTGGPARKKGGALPADQTPVWAHGLQDDGTIPNSRFPLLIYRRAVALQGSDPAAVFEELFERNGWKGTWRNGIYPYPHYHTVTHEVLGVFKGSATVRFGGDRGVTEKLNAGDVVIIPAGVAHQNEGASPDFAVVGAYPGGLEPDMNYGKRAERRQAGPNIERAPLPEKDPVWGSHGPLRRYWRG